MTNNVPTDEDQIKIEAILSAATLFSDLQQSDIRDLARIGQPFSIGPQEVLFAQGEQADGLYVIDTGQVEAVVRLPGEREQRLTIREQGDVVGELALVAGNVRTATVRALQPTTGVKISSLGFESLRLALRPATLVVMQRLCGYIAQRLRQVYAQISKNLVESQVGTIVSPQLDQPFVEPKYLTEPISQSEQKELSLLPFFLNFNSIELEQFLSGLKRRCLERGELLISPDTKLDALYLTLHGAIEAAIRQGDHKQRVRLDGPGTAAAYLSLTDDGPNPLTCLARERSILLEVPRERFMELFHGDDSVAHRFVVAVQKDLVYTLRDASEFISG